MDNAEASKPLLLAGAVLWRRGASGPELLLAHRGGRWGLPRIGVQAGFERAQAARALAEDWCGGAVRPLSFLGGLGSELEGRSLSTWYYEFMLESRAGSTLRPWLRWCNLEQAHLRASDLRERDLILALSPPAEAERQPSLDRPGGHGQSLAIVMAAGILLVWPPAEGAVLQALLLGVLSAALTSLVCLARGKQRQPAPPTIAACAGGAAGILAQALAGGPAWIIACAAVVTVLISRPGFSSPGE